MSRQNSNSRSQVTLLHSNQLTRKEVAKQLTTKTENDTALLSTLIKRKLLENGQGKIIIPKKRLIRKKEAQSVRESSLNTEEADHALHSQRTSESLGQRIQSQLSFFPNSFQMHLSGQVTKLSSDLGPS